MVVKSVNYQTLNSGSAYNNFKQRINTTNQQEFSASEHKTEEDNVKAGAFLGSALGVAATTAVIAKKQGYSLNPMRLFMTKAKNWAIFNINKDKKVKYETGEILALGASSVAGGFIGGTITDDKKNIKAKARESLNQLVGNILIPIGAIGGTGLVYSDMKLKSGKSIQKIVTNAMPQLNGTNKAVKVINGIIKAIPTLGVTAAALGTGIITGNKVSNFINEKIYKKEIDRDIKATDFAPHLDDVCLAASIMAPKSTFWSAVARFVPVVLTVPGYEAGSATEKPVTK